MSTNPSDKQPAAPAKPVSKESIVAYEWRRKTQSPVYIKRARTLSLVVNSLPVAKTLTARKRKTALHYFLDQVAVENTRRNRRAKATADTGPVNVEVEVPKTSLTY